jgi:hypothetical protein
MLVRPVPPVVASTTTVALAITAPVTSSKTTTEIYSHVTAAQERQAAEVLQATLSG